MHFDDKAHKRVHRLPPPLHLGKNARVGAGSCGHRFQLLPAGRSSVSDTFWTSFVWGDGGGSGRYRAHTLIRCSYWESSWDETRKYCALTHHLSAITLADNFHGKFRKIPGQRSSTSFQRTPLRIVRNVVDESQDWKKIFFFIRTPPPKYQVPG